MRVVLGLGANLGDPPATFRRAIVSLQRHHSVLGVSSLFRSEPLGPPQPRYWNMAVLAAPSCSLLELLALCQELEAAAGRQPGERWGPRPLDVDMLIARAAVHRGPSLELPHSAFHLRAFALVPALELAASWTHPLLGRSLAELADRVDRTGVTPAGRL